jgi:hypothetical protein
MTLTRKEFLSTVMTAAAGAASAALLVACGSSSDDDGGGGNCLAAGVNASIGANHGHALVVTAADVMAGAAKTYDIRGSADHTHGVTVSAGAFTMLASNQSAMTISTTVDNHSHSIMLTCN